MEGKVEVVITSKTKKDNGDNKTAINTKSGKINSDFDLSDEMIISSALVYKALRNATSNITTIVNYEVDKYFTLTDDFEGKRDFHIAMNIVKKFGNVAISTFSGAKLGASAGPVGAVVGAVVGFVGSVGTEAINIYQAYNQQEITMRQRNEQLRYTRERSGYSLINGSIGENL